MTPDALEGLHFLARPDFGLSREEDGKAFFADGAGAWFSTQDLDVRKAMEALVARLPESSSVDELVAAMEAARPPVDEAIRSRIADALMRMTLVGLLTASTESLRIARVLSAKPVACPMLRAEAAAGVLHSANLRHEPIRLDIVAQVVTPLLDGSNDRDGLIAATIAAADAGRVTFQRAGQTVVEPADVPSAPPRTSIACSATFRATPASSPEDASKVEGGSAAPRPRHQAKRRVAFSIRP